MSVTEGRMVTGYEGLVDPKLAAMKEIQERIYLIEKRLDLILEKLACVSISPLSSTKPKRS